MSPSVEPFNEAKYKDLMDGLECSEIRLSEAKGAGGGARWDSEYFKKTFLKTDKLLKATVSRPLYSFCNYIKKGVFDLSPDFYQDIGVPFIRTSEIKEPTICFASTVFLNDEINTENSKTILYPNDLVFTKIGAYIGDVAILPHKYSEYNFSQNVAGASLVNKDYGPYLLAFFLSKYGRSQILRSAMLSGQGKLELNDIRNYKVPIFGENFINAIFDTYNIVEQKEGLADSYCNDSENIVTKYTPVVSNLSSSIQKKLSESFVLFGRLDSEYFHPKYEEYEKIIRKSKHGFTFVTNEFDLIKTKCNRTLSKYQYVEIGDIDVGNGVATSNAVKTENLPDNAKILTKAKDILVSTVRPNRGAVAILEEDNLLVSGAFTVLREKGDYPKEVLQVLFRTGAYKDWLLRYNVGTSYPVIKNEDVLNMPIPILSDPDKQKIVSNSKKAAASRRESKQMLEYVKQAVEMAVERGEDIALAWLNDKVK